MCGVSGNILKMYQHSPTTTINNSRRQISIQEKQGKLFEEISILMRASGDADASAQERSSVMLVEKILIQQIRLILDLAMDVANCRTKGSSCLPTIADFEYLLHRNKPKLIRFRKYMRNVQKLQVKSELKQPGGSASNYGMNFLKSITEDTDEEEEEVFDSEKIRRMYRADRISQILSQQKYEEYQKARAWSSNTRNKSDFMRKIIDILQLPKEIQDNPICLEIILFLALETVATIVDYAILTRLNSENLSTDPFIIQSSLSNDMLQLCPEVTLGRGADGLRAIKVQEIQEAMRRVQLMQTQRRLGTSFRNNENSKIPLLAL